MVAPARIARHPMCADDIVSVDPLCPRASGLGASQPMPWLLLHVWTNLSSMAQREVR
jgi:hypothetical protein